MGGIKLLNPEENKDMEKEINKYTEQLLDLLVQFDGTYQEHMNALLRVVSSMALTMGTPKETILGSIDLLYDSYEENNPFENIGVVH